jgi:hypothetical protein
MSRDASAPHLRGAGVVFIGEEETAGIGYGYGEGEGQPAP